MNTIYSLLLIFVFEILRHKHVVNVSSMGEWEGLEWEKRDATTGWNTTLLMTWRG